MDAETWRFLASLLVPVATLLVSSWRIAARLDRIEALVAPVPDAVAQVEAMQVELAALTVRVGVMEDMGPVLR